MKKGIALFSTLLVMTMVMALVTISIDSLTKINTKMRADRDIVQENLTVTDVYEKIIIKQIKSQLSSMKGDKEKYNDTILKLITSNISIKNRINNNDISIKFTPVDGKVDFNLLLEWLNGFDSNERKDFAKRLLTKLGVTDFSLFGKIYSDNIKTNSKIYTNKNLDQTLTYNPNEDSSTIELYDVRKYDGNFMREESITNWDSFYKILDIYVANSDNIEVLNIDWQKYFKLEKPSCVSNNECYNSDINYMDKLVLDVITEVHSSFTQEMANAIATRSRLYYSSVDLGIEPMIEETDKKNGAKSETILDFLKIGYTSYSFLCAINIKSISNKIEYSFILNINDDKNNQKDLKVKIIK